MTIRFVFTLTMLTLIVPNASAQEIQTLEGTDPLTMEGELWKPMVEGINRYVMRAIAASPENRARHWHRDFTSRDHYVQSVQANRDRLSKIIGVEDQRAPAYMEMGYPTKPGISQEGTVGLFIQNTLVGAGKGHRIFSVRWSVFDGVEGEGLLLEPDIQPIANIIALPDCDWTPEMLVGLAEGVAPKSQFARRLAESGCRVLVPFLISRQTAWSGIARYGEAGQSEQPHREFIWRAAYEMGRTMIGLETQKVRAAVDWFKSGGVDADLPLGVIGYGEGGALAFYAAAVDQRIEAAAVCGYFQPREILWSEPIYRNVWSLLEQFGDAEIASLIAPRALIIETCRRPEVDTPAPESWAKGAASGRLSTPDRDQVEREFKRAQALIEPMNPPPVLELHHSSTGLAGDKKTLGAFLGALVPGAKLKPSGEINAEKRPDFDPADRAKRQFFQLVDQTQKWMRDGEFRREEFFDKADRSSAEAWEESMRWYKDYFLEEIIGPLPDPTLAPHPRTRLVSDTPAFRGYEVVLDVYPDVFAYGILLVPKGIAPGEKRPVVVCQHGLEGQPKDVADPTVNNNAYHQYACRLAERGFVTYAPQNPYIGSDTFRTLLRKTQSVKQTLFGFILRQHEVTLNWLAEQDFVDPERIAFYGLSYGGKTAMRIPPLLDRYCLSICSADYNEWIWKTTSTDHLWSYMRSLEYDMPEFNLGNTFNYAEMSWMIFPRPFMVERGHDDGVAPDKWVAYEYARTRRHYVKLGLGDRTAIEFFDGPHSIHGVGTFDFLHKHLDWPKPEP